MKLLNILPVELSKRLQVEYISLKMRCIVQTQKNKQKNHFEDSEYVYNNLYTSPYIL